MKFIEKLKHEIPDKSQAIDELSQIGAIDENTARKAIVKVRMSRITNDIEGAEENLADELCISTRTVKRYRK